MDEHASLKRVLVPLAEGFEEIEAVAPVDILRRAGVEVITAGLQAGPVASSRGVKILADTELAKVDQEKFDLICLPGGMPGTLHLKESARLADIITRCFQGGGYIAAICAAPTVIAHLGLAPGSKITSYPSEKGKFSGYKYREDPVVVDGKIITSRGPGTAVAFGLKLAEVLQGREAAEKVRQAIVG